MCHPYPFVNLFDIAPPIVCLVKVDRSPVFALLRRSSVNASPFLSRLPSCLLLLAVCSFPSLPSSASLLPCLCSSTSAAHSHLTDPFQTMKLLALLSTVAAVAWAQGQQGNLVRAPCVSIASMRRLTVALFQRIETPPSIVQCQPAAIGYSGGQAPYFSTLPSHPSILQWTSILMWEIVSILPGGQSTAAPLQQFPEQASAGVLTWTANIRAGTSITFQIRDSTGTLNYSEQVTIQPGS